MATQDDNTCSTWFDKTFELLRPKKVYVGNFLNRSYPNCKIFQRENNEYVGPVRTWHVHTDQPSKWYLPEFYSTRTDTLVNEAETHASFDNEGYARFIKQNMYSQLAELYGKIVGCHCKYYPECYCQASFLVQLVEDKIKKDYRNVDKKEYEGLKIKYLLTQDKLKMLQRNYEHYQKIGEKSFGEKSEHYHNIYLEHKNAYEKYVNHCFE